MLRHNRRVNLLPLQCNLPKPLAIGGSGDIDFMAVVRDAAEAIVIYDTTGRVIRWNHAAETLLGYGVAPTPGSIPPHLPPPGTPPAPGRYVVNRRHRNGWNIELLVSVAAVRDANGTVVAWSEILSPWPGTPGCPSATDATLAAALSDAIDNAELHVLYQPIFRLADRTPVGAEALLRWRCAGEIEALPERFIRCAEREGLIDAIGLFVMRSACTQLAAWLRDGESVLPISVNVSAQQFRLPEFAPSFATTIRESGIDPRWLKLEITESALVEDPTTASARLDELRALGIGIAIDDFGVGYSSLSRLRQYSIDTLKIDHSFVRDIASDAIAREVAGAVVSLAHKLGMTVVAEGIETEAQYDTLVQLGCDCGQGFLLARPLTPGDLASLTRRT